MTAMAIPAALTPNMNLSSLMISLYLSLNIAIVVFSMASFDISSIVPISF